MPPTVLCVDDDRNLCRILAQALRGEGYRVLLAHDGEQALEVFRQHEPDLVLLDVLLPKRDGFAVLEAIRAEGGFLAETPVLLVTGCSYTPAYRERAEALRAAALVTKPLPLDDLLARLAKQLYGVSRGAQPAKPTGCYRHANPAPVRGELSELPFPALLHHLHGLRASGVLHLRSRRKHKRLELRDGCPVAIRSNLVNECLGNLLVRSGRISQAALVESLRRRRRGEGLQGQVLVAMALLSEEELPAVLREQAEEKLLEVFEWDGGRFELDRGARLERANALPLGRSPANVILMGVRSRFPVELIDSFLAAYAERFVVAGESPFYRFQDIALEPAEAALLAGGGAPTPIGELLTYDVEARRGAYGLVVTGLLEMREEKSSRRVEHVPPSPPVELEQDEGPLRTELAALVDRFRGASYFEILGVAEDADRAEIRRAYAELARRTHPDRFAGAGRAVKALAEEAFALTAQAYETLADPKRRTEYQLDRRRGQREAAEREEAHRALRAELSFQKGEARLRARDYPGALACFEWAVQLYPEEGEYHAYLGWALFRAEGERREALREALKHVRKGAKLAREREKPYLFLGRLYQAAGRGDLAERAFARAVQLQPNCVEALRELRLIWMRRQRSKGLIARLLRRSGPAEAKRCPTRARPG